MKHTLPVAAIISKDHSKPLWQYFNSDAARIVNKLDAWIQQSPASTFSLILFNLENMTPILLTCGEDTSNKVIKSIEVIIKETIGSDCCIEKSNIDYFVIAFQNDNKEKLTQIINDICDAIQESNANSKSIPAYLSIKVGATLFDRTIKASDALDQAFIAFYESKQKSDTQLCIFDHVLDTVVEYQNQMRMAAYFQNILHQQKYRMAFQPVIDSKTGKVKSYESLFRIVTDDGQIISAGPFIPIAEKFGFIDQVDIVALHMVHKELASDPNVSLGLNVSPQTVLSRKWLDHARILLKDPSITSRLIIEITETGMHKNLNKVIEFVDTVQSLGCQIAIDDFGAGYTSFTQLKLLNADIIKIDGIFIRDIVDNHDSRLFVKTLIDFAKAFCLQTVAEFVETGDIAKTLIDLGVDYLQGYYFGKALNHRPWVTDDKASNI